jgi:hypothetical protein
MLFAMRINGIRRFILVHTPEDGSFGVWCNENDLLIQLPKTFRDWKLQPLAEFRAAMKARGYQLEETGHRM